MPRGFIQRALPDNPGLPKLLFQHDSIALLILLQGGDQARGVGYHPDLAID